MGKDRDKGPWWYGWVKFTYYDPFSKSEREGVRTTDYDFATAGQAQRAADSLAGGLAAPQQWYNSRDGKKKESSFRIVSTGAHRVKD